MSAGPFLGVSAIVLRGGAVLLIERGKEPFRGIWSLPGGRVEPGEWLDAAILREVAEETAISIGDPSFFDLHEVIRRDDAGIVVRHFVIAVFRAAWVAGEPVAGDDAKQARFVPLDQIDAYPLTDGAAALIRRAADLATLA